jgi:hypothetical protein
VNKSIKPRILLLWIILWELTGIAVHFRSSIILGTTDFGGFIFLILLTAIPWAVIAIVLWFIFKFIYKAVFHSEPPTMRAIIIVWLFLAIPLIIFPFFIKQSPLKQPKLSNEYSVTVLNEMNKLRVKNGLPIIAVDQKLCAFSKKAALEKNLNPNEKVDLDNPANKAYFDGLTNVSLLSLRGGTLSSDESTATDFYKDEIAKDPTINVGCVADSTGQGGTFFTVFVGGTKK